MMTGQRSPTDDLQFLKLGGSLITNKSRVCTSRPEVLARLSKEIAQALEQNPQLRLVLGNGAGSFGHASGKRFGTREGVHSAEGWRGFAIVWREAARLNQLVTDALHEAGLPAIAIHPSSAVIAQNGKVAAWDTTALRSALSAGLLPVIHGDVVMDKVRGGTILSTEDLFEYLAYQLHPTRIVLAGIEAGVWADYPDRTQIIKEITPENLSDVLPILGGSGATDVTGGMASKVEQSITLVRETPDIEVVICSGNEPDLISRVLSGANEGTLLRG